MISWWRFSWQLLSILYSDSDREKERNIFSPDMKCSHLLSNVQVLLHNLACLCQKLLTNFWSINCVDILRIIQDCVVARTKKPGEEQGLSLLLLFWSPYVDNVFVELLCPQDHFFIARKMLRALRYSLNWLYQLWSIWTNLHLQSPDKHI